ncbi:unnamed protein product [Dracunculus medinensis]|uniref:HIT-type domain-containing protein n=1 Tax=Dracunculus medinensis TaxID=318479 RepID=A0A0N4UKW5_DRAME|nr:unnamed protein product [Dracunculus medinensis]
MYRNALIFLPFLSGKYVLTHLIYIFENIKILVRINATDSKRVLDDATRKRRLLKQIDALEQDNFHEDPHAHLHWHKNIPKFDDVQVQGSLPGRRTITDHGEPAKKKRKLRTEHFKQRFRKNFMALVEEETASKTVDKSGFEAYDKTRAPPSRLPPRHFCTACGFFSKYTCITCGARYCSISCRDLHNDTRPHSVLFYYSCLKWTA